ncbi:MAG: DUF5606 domain-containing protein [Sodaliphilus pleomorphus]|jgi:hypothetical protein|uniref:DUF5606 family protein n=1 Tax=Sodaliphilus pleomorphus TaxID=2606626 RepID=UPI0023F0B9BD|nr:DUF5606 domain-containing protein [Sodaliphilus pleomorphus]MCI5979874.1 DUF5606 domain-containing protein [Muribaculaceae bacterium]MDD7066581.1 DUF5606 domain-containing protein [Sodaliphilus pleomorphus]MDY2832702.1 DUF5606 domain-containing protein [Sodaliphilus pleomorphus]
MLKEVLCISGKPGLYKLISYGKNLVIVESLVDHKRQPAHSRDKIISLGDVAIYTTGDDVPLSNVFQSILEKYDGKAIDSANYKTAEALDEFFKGVLPNYDVDRVYKTDIKKVINWYNILVNAGYTTFKDEEKKEADSQDKQDAK